jgi:hypothetical protein
LNTERNLLSTGIATVNSQTEFVLKAGVATDDIYNGMLGVIQSPNAIEKHQFRVVDWVGSTKTLTIDAAAPFTVDVTGYDINILASEEQILALPHQTAGTAGGVFIAGTNAATTVDITGTLSTVTNLTNAPTNGDLTATMKTSVTTAATAATPTAAAVTGNVGGSVASIAANGITAVTFAADVDAEILSYIVDDATRIDASSLNTMSVTTVPAIDTKIDIIDGIVDDILVDTGTTLQAELDGIQADTEDIQTRLPAALISGRIDASVGAMADDTLTASALAADAVTEIQSGLALESTSQSILTDTAEIGVAGAGLTSIASQSSVNDIPTVSEFEARTLVSANYATSSNLSIVDSKVNDITMIVGTSGVVVNSASKSGYSLSSSGLDGVVFDTNVLAQIEGEVEDGLILYGASTHSADDVWDVATSGHLTSGTTGKALSDSGSAGDPWSSSLPGAYNPGEAGYIVGTNIDALITSRLASSDITLNSGKVTVGTNEDKTNYYIATSGIVAATLSADSITKIQNNLATSASQTTIEGKIDTVDTVVDAIKVVTDKVDDTLEDDGGIFRFTTNALEQGPVGSGSSSDPWLTTLPGTYTSGQAGYILGTNMDTAISSRSSQTSVDDISDKVVYTSGLIEDIPNTSEFEARTIIANDYVVVGDLGTVQTGDSYAIVADGAYGNSAIKTNVDSIKSITDVITSSGVGLTNIPWNNNWDTEVQSEVTDALNAYDPPTKSELDSSVTSITNHGDSNWTTATGFATYIQASGIDTNVNTLVSRVPNIISLENIHIEASGALVYYGGLKPTVSGRTLDISSSGEAGLDFDNIKQATSATTLSNITIPVVTTSENLTTNNDKTGYKLAPDGLDSISITGPAGLATNFREMLIQTWRRFFKKATMTSTQLKTFDDDNTTIITTQTLANDGTTQTQGDGT